MVQSPVDKNKKSKIRKLLIVDDSKIIREGLFNFISLMDNLQIAGTAENYKDALKSVDLLNPDIIVLDISLPDGSGIDILKNVKSRDKSTIVIMLTNYSTDQYRRACEKLGAEYFFDKTTEFDDFIKALQKIK